MSIMQIIVYEWKFTFYMSIEQLQESIPHWHQKFQDNQDVLCVFDLLQEFEYDPDRVLNHLLRKQQNETIFKGKVGGETKKLIEKVKKEVADTIREKICPVIAKSSNRKDLTVTLFAELLSIIQEHFGKDYSAPIVTAIAIYMVHLGIDEFCA